MPNKHNRPFQFLLLFYALAISLFTLSRAYLLWENYGELSDEAKSFIPLLFWSGFRFDTIIVNYALFLPATFSILFYYTKLFSSIFKRFLVWYLTIVSFIFLLAAFSDIGYYQYYSSRLNTGIFSWMGTPLLMIKVVFLDVHYWFFIIFGSGLTFLSYRLYAYLAKQLLSGSYEPSSFFKFGIQSIIVGTLVFFGARGSFDFSQKPIDSKASIFCKYTTINNLSTNGIFNLLHSALNREIEFMDEATAISKVQQYLAVEPQFDEFPLSRLQTSDSTLKKKNVVLVIMESMSANQMGLYGNPKNLTPYLDSLAKQSICFPNIYTSGVHTHNGLYSTLFSQPAILDRIAIREGVLVNQQYYGFPHVLKEQGYRTHFVITGDGAYDNMDSFFPSNGFDVFVSKEDFKKEDIINQWGVPDHIQFNSTMHLMDEAYAAKQPFFTTYMTISTHTPWSLPEDQVTRTLHSEEPQERSYEYADWSIEQFMQAASNKPWYNETIFVFVADHGQRFDIVYEMPLSYHHCPLIIYDPSSKPISWNEKIGLQIDVFPTVMDYLGISFTNNTFGTSLFKHTRPYAYFTADNKIGVLDSTHFFIYKMDGNSGLYDYKNFSLDDISNDHVEKVAAMKEYAFSMLQSSHSLIEKRLVGKPK